MKKKPLTQRKIAEKIGVHFVYLNAILRGRVRPSPQIAMAIEKATKGKYDAYDLVFKFKKRKAKDDEVSRLRQAVSG